MDVVMELYNERPISVQLPDQVEATIVEADAVVKGQTASSSYKPAVLDNGVKVLVPPHITAGTKIVVDVYNRDYVRRADYGFPLPCKGGEGVGASVREPKDPSRM
jgi:elongation factor P